MKSIGPIYLNWEKIWNKFNKWYEKEENRGRFRDWDDQCKKLEKIVESELEKHVLAWR